MAQHLPPQLVFWPYSARNGVFARRNYEVETVVSGRFPSRRIDKNRPVKNGTERLEGDEPLFRALGPGFLVFLILAGSMTVAAAPGGRFSVARADLRPILAQVSRFGPLTSVEGEIREVGEDWCSLWDGRGQRRYPLPEECPVFVNGRSACLVTIRPVAPNAYFWARLWCDRNGDPVVLEATCCGGELLVLAVTADILTGFAPETGETVSLRARGDYCPPGQLVPGQLVYVLLDLDGQIRQVFVL